MKQIIWDKEDETQISGQSVRQRVAVKKHTPKFLYKKAYGEMQLLENIGFEYKDGDSYHILTNGDVDSLSFLKLMLLQQDLEYCLCSTWCMASEDVLLISEWLEEKKINKLDFYVGEIFPTSYAAVYGQLVEVFEKYKCGRIAVFKNHSKIYAGYGDKFYFGISCSANINTNPRCENAVISIDKGLFEFYKNYYDNIVSFK